MEYTYLIIIAIIMCAGLYYLYGYMKRKGDKLLRNDSQFALLYNKIFIRRFNTTFKKIVYVKCIMFVSLIVLLLVINVTDARSETINIKENPRYTLKSTMDINYNDYKVELKYTNKILNGDYKSFREEEILDITKEEIVKSRINAIIIEDALHLKENKFEIAKRIYTRIYTYYSIKKINVSGIIISVLFMTLFVELFLLVYNKLIKSSASNELYFLKNIFILTASVLPVSFDDIIKELIHNSKFYKKELAMIKTTIQDNTKRIDKEYRKIFKEQENVEGKLFFEKLYMAQCDNFELAVRTLKDENIIAEKIHDREVRKKAESIGILGVVFVLIILAIAGIYFLKPWIDNFQGFNIDI
jgi:Ca2+/Na+ antiporter